MTQDRGPDHLLDRAIEQALLAHRGRVDKAGRPYILHPLRVMAGMTSDEARLTAILHDVFEDSKISAADLREAGMPEAVVEAVELLTRPPGKHDYMTYVARLRHNPIARRVKIADLEDNMDVRRLDEIDAAAVRRLNRYRAAWALLRSPDGVDADAANPGVNGKATVSRPWPRTFWILAGRLLAGAYPGDKDPAKATRKLEALRDAGVQHIVNLMVPNETGHGGASFRPYAEEAASLGMIVSVRSIPDQGVPGRREMTAILDDIDGALAQNETVYVHCWGGRGRTGTAVGCWLIHHGATPEDALKQLQALHTTHPTDPSSPYPENERQLQFVRTWLDEPSLVSATGSAISLAHRFAGAVWGHLVGDALGVPYEFKSAAEVADVHWGKKGTWSQPPGTWSDDGGLMLALLDSLLHGGFDLDDQGKRSLAWYRTDAYKPGELFDIGGTTRAALQRIERGTPAIEAGDTGENQNGNGSLMRVLPIALTGLQLSDEDLITRARQASRITHAHPRAQLTCALYCLVARTLLQGESDRWAVLTRALGTMDGHCAGADRDELAVIQAYKKRTGGIYVVDCFWSAWDSFASAVNYEDAVVAAIKLGNDTDTTACVTGGLAGAYWGLRSIPEEWLRGLRGQEIVEPLVQLTAG